MQHYISFPNLGWEFPLSDTLVSFTLFGNEFTIKWYGVLIAVGFLLAMLYGMKRAKEFDVDPDRMIDVALVATLMGFVGARLYYVFFNADTAEYLANPITILYIWEGGIGIYGGIIFAFLFGILMCRWRKVNVPGMCDLASLGFLIGQAFGRWGNFFNQEAFGGNTDLPWAMTGDVIASGVNGTGYDTTLPVHPTFLYESLWCALGFVLLHILSKKAYRFKGQLFCGYLVWYGVGRFFIESLRTDSLMLGTIRLSQLVAVLAVVGGSILFFVLRRRAEALPMTIEESGTTLSMPSEEPTESNDITEEDEDTVLVTDGDGDTDEEDTDNGTAN